MLAFININESERARKQTTRFPLATALKERLALIESKRRLSLTLAKAPVETRVILHKSLYEICVRLGEVSPNPDLEMTLFWYDIISLPDGSVPFDSPGKMR